MFPLQGLIPNSSKKKLIFVIAIKRSSKVVLSFPIPFLLILLLAAAFLTKKLGRQRRLELGPSSSSSHGQGLCNAYLTPEIDTLGQKFSF